MNCSKTIKAYNKEIFEELLRYVHSFIPGKFCVPIVAQYHRSGLVYITSNYYI